MEYKNAENKGRNKKMGLNNKICKDPKYWCKLHRVWLDEEDVKRKNCNCKPTFDMISTQKCNCLVKAENVSMYHSVYAKKKCEDNVNDN